MTHIKTARDIPVNTTQWGQDRDLSHAGPFRAFCVASFAMALCRLGPANFLYSDGDALFAHGDRRKSPVTGKVAAPGLVYLLQDCPPTGTTMTGNGLSVTATGQAIALVASVPLTAETWQQMTEGEVTVFLGGRIVGRRRGEPA